MTTPAHQAPHRISVVVPVYQGERSLPALLAELEPHTRCSHTPDGTPYVVEEVVLVFDHGPDHSAATLRGLAAALPFVRVVWLSRNFGQHAATLAGMASSGGEWIVTLDEDGQHDPADIPRLLDVALRTSSTLVYAQPTNPAPHGAWRNAGDGARSRRPCPAPFGAYQPGDGSQYIRCLFQRHRRQGQDAR